MTLTSLQTFGFEFHLTSSPSVLSEGSVDQPNEAQQGRNSCPRYQIKTPCLFYFRRVKFHYSEETNMMLVAFCRRWWNLLQNLSAEDNKINLCQNLLKVKTLTRTWTCTRYTVQMSYVYASNFLLKNFCKLVKQSLFTIHVGNNKKPAKPSSLQLAYNVKFRVE